ncbi:MFS transporter [Kitasatospora sp. NRRL B-11411]|uniref:MFS transporter n=1 Tax=Kitasatospora sp. NRRL B-11411 TaxID=1463822 RepID=UPI00068A3195|nr:MFS transporter [Kitasatospora sp. NRRL B-11411]
MVTGTGEQARTGPARGADGDSEVLRDPRFRRLWTANGFRDTAAEVAGFSLPVTAVVLLHATALEASLVAVFTRLGYLLVGLPAGAWVDRWRKRTVLLAADLAYALAFASVPATYALGCLTIPQLFAVAFVASVAGVFFDVAHTSVLPLLVSKRRVADANARLQTSENTIRTVSPGTAGLLTQAVPAPLLYGLAACLHLLSSLLVRGVRPARDVARPADGTRRLRHDIAAGIRVTTRQPLVRLLMAQAALNNLGAGVILAVLPVFLLHDLGLAPWLYGALSTAGAAAGVLSSLVGPRLRRRLGEIRMVFVFSALAPVAAVGAPLAGLAPGAAVPLVAAAQVLIGFVVVGRAIASAGLRARVTPTRYMARVAAAAGVVTQGTTPLGALLGGLLATSWSAAAALWAGVALMALPVVLLARSPLRGHRTLPVEWEED